LAIPIITDIIEEVSVFIDNIFLFEKMSDFLKDESELFQILCK